MWLCFATYELNKVIIIFTKPNATVDPSPKAESSHTARVDAVLANEN